MLRRLALASLTALALLSAPYAASAMVPQAPTASAEDGCGLGGTKGGGRYQSDGCGMGGTKGGGGGGGGAGYLGDGCGMGGTKGGGGGTGGGFTG